MVTHTYTHTYTHTHIHTYTHDNYCNPRCAHAHRGLIISNDNYVKRGWGCSRDDLSNAFNRYRTVHSSGAELIMDNADLEKLKVSHGKLLPKFKPSVTSYSLTLASSVQDVKLSPLTADGGASYVVKVSIIIAYIFLSLFSRSGRGC